MDNAVKIQVDHNEVKHKLQEMLRPSGWHDLLKSYLVSEDFDNIITTLETTVAEGRRFTPPLRNVFKAFQSCPLGEVKVIVVGQDPYPQMGVADGIAFSCGNTMKREASLRYIHKAILDTVYKGEKELKDLSPDLSCWAEQGVLLLNTSLTTEIGKIGKHIPIWKSFTAYLFDMLNAQDQTYVWVFLGKKAEELADLVDDRHIKLVASHPASAAYAHQQVWDCNDVFNKVNEQLVALGKIPIKW